MYDKVFFNAESLLSYLEDVGHIEGHDEFLGGLVGEDAEEPRKQLQTPRETHRHEKLAVGAEPEIHTLEAGSGSDKLQGDSGGLGVGFG